MYEPLVQRVGRLGGHGAMVKRTKKHHPALDARGFVYPVALDSFQRKAGTSVASWHAVQCPMFDRSPAPSHPLEALASPAHIDNRTAFDRSNKSSTQLQIVYADSEGAHPSLWVECQHFETRPVGLSPQSFSPLFHTAMSAAAYSATLRPSVAHRLTNW